MALTFRDELDRDLTPAEADDNIRTLQAMIEFLEANPSPGVGITDITQALSALTIFLSNGTTRGPFTMPSPNFRYRGVWTADTALLVGDFFQIAGVGLYTVLEPHTTGETFDPDLTVGGDPAYDLAVPLLAPPPLAFGAPITGDATMTLADANKYFDVNKASLTLITIPPSATEAWTPGDVLTFEDLTGNNIELVEGAGVTINPPGGFQRVSREQFSQIAAIYKGGDVWTIGGDLALI